MKKYNHINWCVLRTPILSISQGREYTQNSKSILTALEDPFLIRILQTVAPELLAKARLSQSREMIQSLHDLILRISRRSQPFSMAAGLSFCPLPEGVKDQFIIASTDQYRVSTLTAKNPVSAPSLLQLNSTVQISDTQIGWLSPPKDKTMGWVKKSLLLSRAQLQDLQRGVFKKIPLQIRKTLVAENLLWEKNQEPLNARASVEMFEHFSKDMDCTKNTKVELFKPVASSQLSQETIHQVLKAAQALAELQSPDSINSLSQSAIQKITQYYKEENDQEFIPLLRFIEENDPKIRHMFDEQSLSLSRPHLESWLTMRLDRLHSDSSALLKLNALDLEEFRQHAGVDHEGVESYPPVLTAVVKIIDSHQKKIWLSSIVGNNPVGYFTRHLHLDPDFEKAVSSLAQDFCEKHPNSLVADLIHWHPETKGRDVMPENDLFPAKILVSCASNIESTAAELNLNDLFIFVRGLRLRLFSKSLQQEVVPVTSNLYNSRNDRNITFRFLAGLTRQNNHFDGQWSWGALEIRDFLPRVEFEESILSPARWRVGKGLLMQHGSGNPIPYLVQALQKKQIPNTFVVLDSDRRLYFDQTKELSMQSLVHFIRNLEFIIIEEYLPPAGVISEHGVYEHDLIIPYLREDIEINNRDVIPPTTPQLKANEIHFSPNSEWTQFNIYLKNFMTSSFLSNQLRDFMKTQLPKNNWFFIQYRDPKWHVRLRIQNCEIIKVTHFLQSLVKKQVINEFTLTTYQREIERYGGLQGCKAFEAISCFDSQAALSVLSLVKDSSFSKAEIWAYAAFFSSLYYLKAFGFEDRIYEYFKSFQKREVSGLYHSEIKQALDQIRRQELGLTITEEKEVAQIERIYLQRSAKQNLTVKTILKLAKTNQLGRSIPHFINSLIHLSLNRLDADLTNSHEVLTLKTILNIENAKKKRSLGKSRSAKIKTTENKARL